MSDPTYAEGVRVGKRWGFWAGVVVGLWVQAAAVLVAWVLL